MKKIKILVVEDNPADALLLKRQLTSNWSNLKIDCVKTREDYLGALASEEWDLIISDYSLPQFDGLAALKLLKEKELDIPFIMVSCQMGEEKAVDVMREGAQDYIVKDNLERIVPAVKRELEEWKTRSENLKQREELKKSALAWLTTFSSIGDSVMLVDAEGKIQQFNIAALDTFGKTEAELLEMNCCHLFEIPEEEEDICPFRVMKTSLKRETAQFMRGNRWLEVTVDPVVSDNKLISAIHITKDITRLVKTVQLQRNLYKISIAVRRVKSLSELLVQIRKYLSRIVETQNTSVVLWDAKAAQLYEPEDEFKGRPYSDAVQKKLFEKVISRGEAVIMNEEEIAETVAENQSDSINLMKHWLGVPLQIEDKIIGAISVFSYKDKAFIAEANDVVGIVANEIAHAIERKLYEQDLRFANEKLRALHKDMKRKVDKAVDELREKDHIIMEQSRQAAVNEMISQIAHHWRQPLNAIGVTVQSILDDWEFDEFSGERLGKKVELAMSSLNSLSHSIDNFRLLYKNDFKTVEFDIRESLDLLIIALQDKIEQNQIKLNVSLAPGCIISGAANHFSQAVMNIINNACDVLKRRKIEEPQIWLTSRLEKDFVKICVKDNAGGIEDDMFPRLFKLYSSTKETLNNTGLGLYMARTIIETNMGGNIRARNEDDGAEFIIRLPLSVDR